MAKKNKQVPFEKGGTEINNPVFVSREQQGEFIKALEDFTGSNGRPAKIVRSDVGPAPGAFTGEWHPEHPIVYGGGRSSGRQFTSDALALLMDAGQEARYVMERYNVKVKAIFVSYENKNAVFAATQQGNIHGYVYPVDGGQQLVFMGFEVKASSDLQNCEVCISYDFRY